MATTDYTPDYGSQYSDILAKLNQAFTNSPTNDNYTSTAQGKQFLDLISRAQQLGVDPSQLNPYVNAAVDMTGTNASNTLRSGGSSGTALNNALGSLGAYNSDISSLLQLPQEKYNQTQATNNQIASDQAQRDAVRSQILSSIPGLQNQLGDQLLTQEQQAYTKMAPQIENRLNSLGLLQSGALPEANAKYQAQLEDSRQNQLAQFGLNAQQNLAINFPLQGLSQDMATQSQNVQNGFQLDLANINRNFQNQDMNNATNLQKQLSLQALDAARAAQSQQSSDSLRNGIISGILNGGSQIASAYIKK